MLHERTESFVLGADGAGYSIKEIALIKVYRGKSVAGGNKFIKWKVVCVLCGIT